MPQISDEEYAEFELLRERGRFEAVRASVLSVETLEEDVDEPLRLCVAMLALLGCEPMWSCCGFDYFGQPLHKSHQYGLCGIVMRDNENSRCAAEEIPNIPYREYFRGHLWQMKFSTHYGNSLFHLTTRLDGEVGNVWPNRNCIHFSEPAVIAIGLLEEHLMSRVLSEGSERITLRDSNGAWRDRFPAWQYPERAAWHITKTGIVNTYNAKRGTQV